MKKYGLIFLAVILLLIGCYITPEKDYTPAKTTLSGEEVEQRLGKIRIKEQGGDFLEDGTGQISFYLSPKGYDNDLELDFNYTDFKVSTIEIFGVDNDEEFFDSYIYYIKDKKNYSYVVNGHGDYCETPADGEVDDKNNVCKGGDADNSKSLYREFCATPLEQAGIIKEDLITFGNYYYQKHKSEIEIRQ